MAQNEPPFWFSRLYYRLQSAVKKYGMKGLFRFSWFGIHIPRVGLINYLSTDLCQVVLMGTVTIPSILPFSAPIVLRYPSYR